MSKYFIESDFSAFDVSLATSEKSSVIADRMVVQGRLKDLHLNGLKVFMQNYDLYPHWKEKTNLTNVLYPFFKANGGSVTYIRLGYGKSKAEIDNYAKRISIAKLSGRGYLKDDMAFHYLSQIQLSLHEKGWDTAFYLGNHGWLEQRNLVMKIGNIKEKANFISILDDLKSRGYEFSLYSDIGTMIYKDSNKFTSAMIDLTNRGVSYTIYISKPKTLSSKENDKSTILDYVKDEFSGLMPIYRFVAWDINNNYIPI